MTLQKLLGKTLAPSAIRAMSTRKAVICGAVRTPVGAFQGVLASFTAPQLGVQAVKGLLEKTGLGAGKVEEVIYGNVLQGNVGQAPARQVALGAGCPYETEAVTINKVCASGLKTVMLAAASVKLGERDCIVAGGMESMSNAPFYFPRKPATFGNVNADDAIVKDGLTDVYDKVAMGVCAEKTAADHSISREDQDEYAIRSYKRAQAAAANGAFDNEIIPVTIVARNGSTTLVTKDEEPDKVAFEKIPKLKPVFKPASGATGTITAANASTLNDGASALLVTSEEFAQSNSLKPIAEIIGYADAAVAPVDFPVAPAKAVPIALKRAGVDINDVALFEINEAFSCVAIANAKLLNVSQDKVNINGGAVALGHALGNSGSRILVTLTHALKSGEVGVAAVCNGGGGGSAVVIRKL